MQSRELLHPPHNDSHTNLGCHFILIFVIQSIEEEEEEGGGRKKKKEKRTSDTRSRSCNLPSPGTHQTIFDSNLRAFGVTNHLAVVSPENPACGYKEYKRKITTRPFRLKTAMTRQEAPQLNLYLYICIYMCE